MLLTCFCQINKQNLVIYILSSRVACIMHTCMFTHTNLCNILSVNSLTHTNTNTLTRPALGWIRAISRVNQSNLVILIMPSCMGKLVRHLRKTVIKTSGSRVPWWSGSLHLQLIRRHAIANSWPSNAVCSNHEVRLGLFLSPSSRSLKGKMHKSCSREYSEQDRCLKNLKRQV